jgi:peptidoglycan/LPS O-acetylase OafA/YrhL
VARVHYRANRRRPFFVLSGYLITGILLANRGASNYFAAFYARRSFRIMPIYFLTVAVYLVGRQFGGGASALFGGPLPWWSYVLGIQNFWMAAQQTYGAPWLAVTWSLAVEEQFYLIFPLVVYLVPIRTLPRVLIGLLILCPVGRIVVCALGDRFAYYVLMPLRADCLAIGALVAWLQFASAITDDIRRKFRRTFLVTACLLPVFAWVVKNTDTNNAVFGHTYLVALYGSTVFMVVEHRGAPQLAFLRSSPAAFFARISYALYLTHGCVIALAFMAAGVEARTILSWQGAALTALAFAVSVAISEASHRLIEKPLIGWAHGKYPFGGPKPLAAMPEALGTAEYISPSAGLSSERA